MNAQQLLTEISDYCRRTGLAESTFGRRAVNDGKLAARLRNGGRITTDTLDRIHGFMQSNPAQEHGAAARPAIIERAREPRPAAAATVPAAPLKPDDPQRNFRFFDNRQKYLLFVNTCSEKWEVAHRVSEELVHIHPRPPAVRAQERCVEFLRERDRVTGGLEHSQGTQASDRMVGEPTVFWSGWFDGFATVASEVLDAAPLLARARMIKTAQEIERMRLANELAALAMLIAAALGFAGDRDLANPALSGIKRRQLDEEIRVAIEKTVKEPSFRDCRRDAALFLAQPDGRLPLLTKRMKR